MTIKPIKIKLSRAFLFLLVFTLSTTSLRAVSQALDDYIATFNDKMSKKEPLSYTGCFDSGNGKIQQISLYYSSNNPQELGQAREMFVSFVSQFLDGLNQNNKLKFQLNPYPFSVNGLDIVIFYRTKKGTYAPAPNIGQIALKNGKINYYTYSKSGFKEVRNESFLDAKKLSE
jgi:hypothetical protein